MDDDARWFGDSREMLDVSERIAKVDVAVELMSIGLVAAVVAGVLVVGVLDHAEEPLPMTHYVIVGRSPAVL
jgi:hypothetical protein